MPFYSVLGDSYYVSKFLMVIFEFVTSWYYKSLELAQASLSWRTVAQVSDVAHGPLVYSIYLVNAKRLQISYEIDTVTLSERLMSWLHASTTTWLDIGLSKQFAETFLEMI